MNFRDNPQFQRGEEFERALSLYLQTRGWGVLPVYDYSGDDNKAPKMHRVDGGMVLPDLFTARAGKTFWCEAKRKTRADFTHITQRLETGIPLRLYREYQRVKAESGIDVWLFFGHERENEVRCTELDALKPRIYAGPKMSNGGMAFWGWDDLIRLCPLTDILGAPPVAA
jgi:hypothetical protein